MRYSYAAIFMIIVGMMTFVVLMVFQDVTINNEADYYSIKEAMEASMVIRNNTDLMVIDENSSDIIIK